MAIFCCVETFITLFLQLFSGGVCNNFDIKGEKLRKEEDSHSRSSLFSFWGWMNLKLRDEEVQWMWVLKGQRKGRERTSEEELHHHCGWDDTWNLSFNSFFSFFTSPPISFGLARSLFFFWVVGDGWWLQSVRRVNTLVENIRREQPTQLDYHTSTDWTVKFASSSFLPFALTISSGRFPSFSWSNTSTERNLEFYKISPKNLRFFHTRSEVWWKKRERDMKNQIFQFSVSAVVWTT